jgi:hypothetical protein
MPRKGDSWIRDKQPLQMGCSDGNVVTACHGHQRSLAYVLGFFNTIKESRSSNGR